MATHTTGVDETPHSHARTYTVIWLILLIATALTVVTAKAHLGGWALGVALAVASTKALLVLLYFMHLNEATGTIRIVAGTAFFFIALMISFQLGDFATRFPGLNGEGSQWSAMPAPAPRHMQGFEIPNPEVGRTP